MSFINKLFDRSPKLQNTVQEAVKEIPVYRLCGMQRFGAHVRPKDTRTTGELLATIDALAERNPSVTEFVKEIKTMNPEHLGLAADTLELANCSEMLMSSTNINMNKVAPQTGKSLLQHLLSIYPKASKENPKSIEFAQEVINNTDTLTSKYFLADCHGYFEVPQAAQHLEALKPMVRPFAEATLDGGYLGTFEKQKNFTDLIKGILTPKAKPEKISLMPNLYETVENVPKTNNFRIVLNKFAESDAPIKQVKENIEVLPQVLQNAVSEGKKFDVVDFVNKNVNLY